ncbi:hypothetical protein KDL01_38545 [Actinospica durhamensis]|uniref:Uncharacterized protein n=1 Tax=Actinospica durhamensis TaxID=1508375 RepID=A0A941EY63_9ACTN|nr:hypothetical protein [Actinospica durhamensis]MBR7839226.1 hypothetical protein [Actinospica durhamensis]
MSRTTPRAAEAPVPAPTDSADAGLLRANLAPSAGVGAVMGFAAATEGAGPGYGAVVGVAGCAAVFGMLALKRALAKPVRSSSATKTGKTAKAAKTSKTAESADPAEPSGPAPSHPADRGEPVKP